MDFSDIETAVITSLKDTGLKEFRVKDFDVRNEKSTLVAPAVFCSIESGKAVMVGEDIKWDLALHVTVVFSHIKGEAERRKGIYPIIAGIITYLTGKDLGLKIDELEPLTFRNITDREDAKSTLTVFSIQFRTAFTMQAEDEEDNAKDLIKVGVGYLLDPARDTVYVSDEIDLSE